MLSRVSWLALLFLLIAAWPCAGQSTGSLTATPVSGAPGSTVTVDILLSNDTPADGFSFGLTHDAGLLTVLSVLPGPALDPDAGGVAPDFFLENLDAVGGPGVTVGCLIDFGPPPFLTIPIGVDHGIVQIDYGIDPAAQSAVSPLEFSSVLGSPPVEVLLILDAVEVTPTTVAGSVEVVEAPFVRGDCSGDGHINLIDPIFCLRRLFGIGDPSLCLDADDANDSGTLEMIDATFLLIFLFGDGSPPPAPFDPCEADPSADTLNCAAFPGCP